MIAQLLLYQFDKCIPTAISLLIYVRESTSKCMRSNRSEVLWKIAVLENLVKFTGKHLYRSLFFSKVAGQVEVFSCDLREIFKTALLQNTYDLSPSRQLHVQS